MPRFGNLKINAKFNLIMSLLLVALLLVTALMAYKRQRALILVVAKDNARLLSRQIIDTRDYMSSVVHGEPDRNYGLVPQVVATQVAKRTTKGSKYYVRQVSLRYRNPDNKPDEYEAAMLERFAGKPPEEASSIITVGGKKVFRYMLSMVAEKSCLECHGEYEKAPAFVRERFSPGHYSYNYRLGEVIGAVSVTIPMVDLYREIGLNLELDLATRGVILVLIISVMALLLRRSIIDPVTMLSKSIVRVTRTGNFTERLPRKGQDEIGELIGAFNDMMEELDRKTHQSRESEDRYRKFIAMSRSAVLTFLADGKIVISNQKAEEMLGLSRQELLGESIFRFLDDGDSFRLGLEKYLEQGSGGGVGETVRRLVRVADGRSVEMELSLTASTADQSPMFTAILRDPTAP